MPTLHALATSQLPKRRPRKLPLLRPIRSEAELEQATQLAFLLSESAETKDPGADESDYLEVLFTLEPFSQKMSD